MSKYLEINQKSIDKAVERYAEYWDDLSPVDRELAKKIVILTECSGGRAKAATIMGIGPTTLDNYRAGKTQPKFLEVMKLAAAAERPIEYLLSGTGVWNFSPPSAQANDQLDRERMAMAIETVEEALQGRKFKRDKKAELILAVYDMLAEGVENTDNIIRLVRAA